MKTPTPEEVMLVFSHAELAIRVIALEKAMGALMLTKCSHKQEAIIMAAFPTPQRPFVKSN